MANAGDRVRNALRAGLVVPAFNVPYLPMVEPVVQAAVDEDAYVLIETARLEWIKFEGEGPEAVMREFSRWAVPDHVGLHLDHVPAIDEDGQLVDYAPILQEAIDLGYGSIMIDASRLDLEGNVAATRVAVEMAHRAGIPCEAELGAVLGHESGPLPPYAELFASGRGFTDVGQARRFVVETACDWLSVAVGNIHGAVSGAAKDEAKIEARLDLKRVDALRRATDVPLVLHGGSGVNYASLLAAIPLGIAKVNVGSEIRRAYEGPLREGKGVAGAQQAVYERTCSLLRDYFHVAGKRETIAGPARTEEGER